MSQVGDTRDELAALFEGLSYGGEGIEFYRVEPKPGTALGRRYLSLWNTATTDMVHVFELRLYASAKLGLEGSQEDLDEVAEVVDALIPRYINDNGWTVGWSEETGQIVAVWTLHPIRKQQHS